MEHYFIVADDAIIIPPRNTNIVAAVDLLIKVQYCFNVDYSPNLLFFYNSVEVYVYEVLQKKPYNCVKSCTLICCKIK